MFWYEFTFIHPEATLPAFKVPGPTRCKARDLAYLTLQAAIKAQGLPDDNRWKLLHQTHSTPPDP